MKLGCTSFSFNKEFMKGKMDINSFIKMCKELDINSVELWDEHFEMFLNQGGSISILRSILKDYNAKLLTIAVNNHDFTSEDSKKREHDINTVVEWMHKVKELGCSFLRVLPGDLIELNKEEEKLLPFVFKSFERCLKEAEKLDLVLAIENCPRKTNPLVTIKIVKKFNSPYIKLCPDIGNIREDIRYSTFEPLLPYACHIHAKTYSFNEDGEECSISYEKVFGMIKKAGFDESISIEFEGEGDELVGVKNSLALMKRYII